MGSSSGHLGSSQGNLAALHFQVSRVGFRVKLEEIQELYEVLSFLTFSPLLFVFTGISTIY
jgi:hypothetical protein